MDEPVAVRPLLDEEVSPGRAIVKVLEQAGIHAVFGMPGGNTFAIFDALADHRDTIRAVLVREEAKAGIMAEVYGRLTGRPGVAIGQGAFLVHASMGAIEAHLSSSPMLLLSELSDNAPFSHHGPYQSGTGEYGSWDAAKVFGGMTKITLVANSPTHAVQCTQLALKHALTGEPGPVAVLYWSGALRGRVGPDSRPALYDVGPYLSPASRTGADPAEVERAAGLLAGADRPVIVAGGGVRMARAFDELAALADQLGAPVASTAGGKSCYPETGGWALGVMGNFGTPLANALVGEADVVLVVGSKLGPTDSAAENPLLLDPVRQRIVQIDVEPQNASWTFPASVALVGDARLVLGQLAEAVGTVPADRRRDRRTRLDDARARLGHFDAPELQADKVPILPQRVIGALQEAVDEDTFVTCDAGENRIFMTHYFQTKGAGTFVQPAGIGGMGYSIPAALAA
jgi:acetolactate synthase-1/2/3 large subunit